MPINTFFENFRSVTEQSLIEDLIIESIKIYGFDAYYLPRVSLNYDPLLGEDILRKYSGNYPVEMYIRTFEGFEGDGDFMSKFNLQIRDQLTLTVANRQFNNYVGKPASIIRPREGDLIYFPLDKKVYEIKFVEHQPVFFQMGALQTYDLKCELFEYSSEILSTGIAEVDSLQTNSSLDTAINPVITDADPVADNITIQQIANTIIDFTEEDPFSNGAY